MKKSRRVTLSRLAAVFVLSVPLIYTPAIRANQKPAPQDPISVDLIPHQLTLWGAGASQHFLVTAKYADGLVRDVTPAARFSVSQPATGEMDSTGKFVGRSSGETTVTATVGNRSSSSVVRVEEQGQARPFSFAIDIDRILTRQGCNDSSCHGGVKGRGGFKLSVYAINPRDDYRWIVEGGTFRVLTTDTDPKHPRISLKEPEKSLLLLKPTFTVPHGGGLRFKVGSQEYQALVNWIRAGALYGDDPEKQGVAVKRVDVTPKEVVVEPGKRQQLLVTAYLSNGRQEDVTDQVRYVSNDAGVAGVSEGGVIQAKKLGETAILIRTPGRTLSTDVGVIAKPIPKYPKVEARNYIDQLVFAKLRRFQILPSELSTDEEFLRRVCLDLTGTLPPPRRVREFLADKEPHKRDRLIEVLLNSPEYVDYWSFRFSDLLRPNVVNTDNPEPAQAYQDWIVDSIAANKPYDQMARERIAAQGYSAAARNFYYIGELTSPEMLMPELIRLFMGRRIECAQCHNHPFETWSQNQFWGLAAFFAGYTDIRGSKLIIDVLGGGHVDQPKEMMVTNPRTKQKVTPAFLDGTPLPQSQWMDPRMQLAKWITSHPYFAEATVNRMWSLFFGRGIIDPVDDFRSTNPPTYPELLQALADDFRTHGYDLKHLIRTIVQSRTYQLSGAPNESNKEDRIDYSHALPRPLEAAILLDAITNVTGVPEKFTFHPYSGEGEAPLGTRAVQTMPDICPSLFMDDFGRSMRHALPSAPPQPNLLEALHMLAGPSYTTKISQPTGRLDQLLKKGSSNERIIDDFYLAALTRFPTPSEKTQLLEFVAQRSSQRQETLARFVWALLRSRQFAYNH
jgi:hypothetical protein